MPQLRIFTNIRRSDIPKDFLKELVQVLAKTLEKPAELCSVMIIPDQLMQHGTQDGPCGQGLLGSIGSLGETENIRHSKVISDKLSEIGIPPDRLFINFEDKLSSHVCARGTTVKVLEDLAAKK